MTKLAAPLSLNKIVFALMRRVKELEINANNNSAQILDHIPESVATDHGVDSISEVGLIDQSADLQALVDQMVAAIRGEKLWIPANTYVVNDGFSVPENRAITVEGDGPGWRSTGGKGTVLMRLDDPAVASTPMLYYEGTDSGDTHRSVAGLKNLQFDGGGSAGVTDGGPGFVLQRGQETPLENVRFYNFPKTAMRVNQVFNASWRGLRVTHSGNGTTDAALHIGAAGAPGNIDGTITLDIFGLEQEQNGGTDLRITGNPTGVGHPSTEINVIGGKWEGGIGVAAPYHHLEFAELVNFSNAGIFCHRTYPPILIQHLVSGDGEDRRVSYDNYWIEIAPSITPPDYLIRIEGGSISYRGEFRGDPAIADVYIDSAVRPGAVDLDVVCITKVAGGGERPLSVVDNRTVPEF